MPLVGSRVGMEVCRNCGTNMSGGIGTVTRTGTEIVSVGIGSSGTTSDVRVGIRLQRLQLKPAMDNARLFKSGCGWIRT